MASQPPFPFSAAQVAYGEALMRSLMTSSCRLERRALAAPASGGEWREAAGATVDLPCLIAPTVRQATEQVAGQALEAASRWEVTLPAGTAVDPTDWIRQLVAGAPVRLFEVVGVRAPRSLEIRTVCDCVERL